MNSGTTEFTGPSRALSDDINENNLIFLTEGEVGSQMKMISHCPLKESGMMLSVM